MADYAKFKELNNNQEFPLGTLSPCLLDARQSSGVAKGHYFFQDLHVAQMIYASNPRIHFDIGSRVDGFVAHVASFRDITVVDIRPQFSSVKNITFLQADLSSVNISLRDVADSISSLHAIEHFGLGRYGDPLEPLAHVTALKNIHLMLSPGGKFYFSVPVGKQRVEFNEQRVFSFQYLTRLLTEWFTIDSFSLVNDQGELMTSLPLDSADTIKLLESLHYGCGIYVLTKRDPAG